MIRSGSQTLRAIVGLSPIFALFLSKTLSAPLPSIGSFFDTPSHFAERMSSDGEMVAYLGSDDNQPTELRFVHVNQPNKVQRIALEPHMAATAFFWIGKDRLLWQAVGQEQKNYFFLSHTKSLTTRRILADEKRFLSLQGVVDSLEPCLLMGISDEPSSFPDLYRLHLDKSEAPELMVVNHDRIITWAWNEEGKPVAGLSWTQNGGKVIYHLHHGKSRAVFRADPEDDARLLFASLDGAKAFVLSNKGHDLTRLISLELSTGKCRDLASDPCEKVDVESYMLDEKKREILAAGYSDEGIRWKAIDPLMKPIIRNMERTLHTQHLSLLSIDASKTKFLIKVQSSRHAGTVFHYDAGTQENRKLWDERPSLLSEHLSETSACDYRARDGCTIPAYLTKPRIGKAPWPLVVFPHGGPRLRTHPGFDGRVQFLASRGYAVFQPNYRGSRGYGKKFMNAGDGQWGKGRMQNDVTDGVDFFIKSGLADPQRIAIFGGSYGGYSALAGLAFTPEKYVAGISLFGISDLLAYTSVFSINDQAYAGDAIRRIGDPSTPLGRRKMSELSPWNYAHAFQSPVLIYHGALDKVIPASHSQKMVDALRREGKGVEFLFSQVEGHGFSDPATEIAVYRAIELFLQQHLGGKIGPEPKIEIVERLTELKRSGRGASPKKP